ncbi:MAG: hypothetical protein K2K15_00470, partial [Anaeroplasmataceae bacterium]|nr:hypothetical protein [Anaeroplasmataceae bacterium]
DRNMDDFKRVKKTLNISLILTGVSGVSALISAFILEILSEANEYLGVILFLVMFIIFAVSLGFVIIFYRLNQKTTKKILNLISQEVKVPLKISSGGPCLDLLKDSYFPFDTKEQATSKEVLEGNIDIVPFEYHLLEIYKDGILIDKKAKYELYIFKDVSIFQEEFIATTKELSEIPAGFTSMQRDSFMVFAKDPNSFTELTLPEGICFISFMNRTLYVYKCTELKQPSYMRAKSAEECKKIFEDIINDIEKTFCDVKEWIK